MIFLMFRIQEFILCSGDGFDPGGVCCIHIEGGDGVSWDRLQEAAAAENRWMFVSNVQ